MKCIGAQLYTVREKLTSSDEIKTTLAAIKNIGYDSVQLFDSIDLLHLKDMKRIEEGHTFAELGNGNLYFEGIINTALNCDITNFIVEQDICDGDAIESLKQSYKFIKSLLEV